MWLSGNPSESLRSNVGKAVLLRRFWLVCVFCNPKRSCRLIEHVSSRSGRSNSFISASISMGAESRRGGKESGQKAGNGPRQGAGLCSHA